MKYSIDTSAILDGWRRYYPKDVFPTVWRRLDYLIMGGRLIATEEVLRELEKQDDDVYRWVKMREARMVVPIDGPTQVEVSTILKTYPKLVKEQTNRQQADPWVIALARIVNGVVVFGEKRRSLINPRIPDVCDDMGVTHMELVDVFRREGFSI